MATVTGSSEQRVVLHSISREFYESLLYAHQDRRVPRFTYDRGDLEIVSPSSAHEELIDTVVLFINIVAEEIGINLKGFGSATFRLEDQDRGFEPDACFYVQNLGRILGKKDLDLRLDPPPDLAIEIDITSSSLDKFSLMAEAGIPELWWYDSKSWRILALQEGKYEEQESSFSLPILTATTLALLIEESRTLEPLAWVRRVREWVRTRNWNWLSVERPARCFIGSREQSWRGRIALSVTSPVRAASLSATTIPPGFVARPVAANVEDSAGRPISTQLSARCEDFEMDVTISL